MAVCSAPAWSRLAKIPPATRELMVPVTGGRIYARVSGDLAGPKPPLVAINGGPGGSHIGMVEMLALADERAVILYDQLDTGRSDHPDDPANWTVPRFVSELGAIKAALGVTRWHVLGQSWGGTVALEYGARRPEGLASLILSSPLISTRSWIADADALRRDLPPMFKPRSSTAKGVSPRRRNAARRRPTASMPPTSSANPNRR